MRLATFLPPGGDEPLAGEVRGDERRRVRRRLHGAGPARRPATAQPRAATRSPLAEVELLAPVPRPRAIFGIGLNYAAHAARDRAATLPEAPIVFMKLPTLGAPPNGADRAARGGAAPRLRGRARRRHGRRRRGRRLRGRRRRLARATCSGASRSGRAPRASTALPVRARGSRPPTRSATRTTCALRTWVNGELRQDSTTADLIFGVPQIVALPRARRARSSRAT